MLYVNGSVMIHLGPLGALMGLLGLELAVGMIQAYVICLLSSIYIGDMESGGH